MNHAVLAVACRFAGLRLVNFCRTQCVGRCQQSLAPRRIRRHIELAAVCEAKPYRGLNPVDGRRNGSRGDAGSRPSRGGGQGGG